MKVLVLVIIIETIKKCKICGMDDYTKKPLKINELLSIVKREFDKRSL